MQDRRCRFLASVETDTRLCRMGRTKENPTMRIVFKGKRERAFDFRSKHHLLRNEIEAAVPLIRANQTLHEKQKGGDREPTRIIAFFCFADPGHVTKL